MASLRRRRKIGKEEERQQVSNGRGRRVVGVILEGRLLFLPSRSVCRMSGVDRKPNRTSGAGMR